MVIEVAADQATQVPAVMLALPLFSPEVRARRPRTTWCHGLATLTLGAAVGHRAAVQLNVAD